MVRLGEVVGVHGVRGWVKIFSHARPRESIFEFRHWWLGEGDSAQAYRLIEGGRAGKGLRAKLEGVDDRDQATRLAGQSIHIPLADLPSLAPGEYYWAELLGLRVMTLDGSDLGTVSALMETGANDVLVVVGERERLIPYTPQTVREVDVDGQTMTVDWDPDF